MSCLRASPGSLATVSGSARLRLAPSGGQARARGVTPVEVLVRLRDAARTRVEVGRGSRGRRRPDAGLGGVVRLVQPEGAGAGVKPYSAYKAARRALYPVGPAICDTCHGQWIRATATRGVSTCPPCSERRRRAVKERRESRTTRPVYTACADCGVDMRRATDVCTSCRAKRKTEAARLAKGQKSCLSCRAPMPHVRANTCGVECAYELERAARRRHRRTYRTTPAGRAELRAMHARRRALLASARVDKVDPHAVHERDGWRCHLCSKLTDRRVSVPHPKAPTLDHLIPLAAGGDHSYVNVATAHFSCNTRRQDRGTAQLRCIA